MYEYTANLLRVVDADTVWLDVDLGFDIKRKDSFRLYGINAPELSTPEGRKARDWLVDRLSTVEMLTITTEKDKREKYGRYLCTLWDGELSINDQLVASGYAVEYKP